MPLSPRKTTFLQIRLAPELKAAAELAAREDQRTLTSLIEKLLVDHLRATGHWPADGKARASERAKKR